MKEQIMSKTSHLFFYVDVLVIVVDNEGAILLDDKTVAKDEETAKFTVGICETLRAKGSKPSDVTIICRVLGQVKVDK